MSAAAATPISVVDIGAIVVGERKRALREMAVGELAASIRTLGLLHPIMLAERDGGLHLVAGLHRLEACRRLGWETIPAIVRAGGDLDAELAEIDENLKRAELSILERGEHLVRRSEILKEMGVRAPSGRPRKGASDAPLSTTEDLAEQAGIAKRTAQEDMNLARALPPEVRDLLRPTIWANRKHDLQGLTKLAGEHQKEIARLLANGEADSVWGAERAVTARHEACRTCSTVIDRYEFKHAAPEHCDQCGGHFEAKPRERWLEVCGACGWKPYPNATPPPPPSRDSSAIVGQLPGAFYKRGGHRDTGVDLPMPGDGEDTRPPADPLAFAFADAVDVLLNLDPAALLALDGSSRPIVRTTLKSLLKWLERMTPATRQERVAS
jgi:hypothetical protein